jgi:hypothetical protein
MLRHAAGGYTSYDYAAAIKETRELTPKYNELKLQSLFLRSVQDIYKTDLVCTSCSSLQQQRLAYNPLQTTTRPHSLTTPCYPRHGSGTQTRVPASSSSVKLTCPPRTWFHDPAEPDAYHVSSDVRTFKLTVDGMTLPQLAGTLALNGRDSRVVT